MSFDLTQGNAYFQFTAPTSGTVTGRDLSLNITRSMFASETDATNFYALWTDTDKTKCRFVANDGITELPFDITSLDLTVGSEEVVARVNWADSIATGSTYGIYFLPALTANTAYGVSDTYGQYNAYSSGEVFACTAEDVLDDRTSTQITPIWAGTAAYTDGIMGQAFDLDGASRMYDNTMTSALGISTGFKVGAWLKTSSSGATQCIITNDEAGGTQSFRTFVYSDGTAGFQRYDNTGTQISLISTSLVNDGTWHHVVGTFDTTNGSVLYIDGVSEATDSDVTENDNGIPSRFEIGSRASSGYFTGQIDEISVEANGVTADEVLWEYQQVSDNVTWLGTATYNEPSTGTTYAVTYDGNGNDSGTAPVDGSSPYDSGSTVTVLDNTGTLALTDYTFNGWNTASDGSGTAYVSTDTFAITSITTLYAQWVSVATTYNVTYDDNGSDGGTVPTDSTDYSSGDTVTVLGNSGSLTLTDYTFNGWNTASDGSGTSYVESDTLTITSATTLYAQWSAVATTYSVTYNDNGSDGGTVPTDSTVYSSGDTVTVLGNSGTLTLTDYTFSGWNTTSDGTGTTYVEDGTFTISSDTTIYAVWVSSADGFTSADRVMLDNLNTIVTLVLGTLTAPDTDGGLVTAQNINAGLDEDELEQLRDAVGIDGTKTTATGGQIQDIYIDTQRVDALIADVGDGDQFTETALELAPSGTSTGATAEEVRIEMDSNSTQLAAIVEDTGTTLPAQISAIEGSGDILSVNGVAVSTIDDFKADVSGVSTSTEVSAVSTLVSGLNDFDPTTDEVITDSASRTASQADVSGLSTFDPDVDILENGKTFSQILRRMKAWLCGDTSNSGTTALADDGVTTRGTVSISSSNRSFTNTSDD